MAIDPHRAALESAHRAMASKVPLGAMLQNRHQTMILKLLALRYMRRTG